MEITYSKVGQYFIPNFTLPPSKPVGKYGMLRRKFLIQNHRALYSALKLKGTLIEHLHDVDKLASKQVELLVSQIARSEGVDEALKNNSQMLWVQKMNNIKNRAEEIVLHDIVYKEGLA